MLKKNVAPQKARQTTRSHEVTEQELAQATGGVMNNPLYTSAGEVMNPVWDPQSASGMNPLYGQNRP